MNYKSFLLALGAFFFQLAFVPILAVKADPRPITITQPDGTKLMIRLRGDEFHHYKTTEDGFLLKANTQGYLTYATINAAGESIPSEMIATDMNKRSPQAIQFLKNVLTSNSVSTFQNSARKSRMLTAKTKPQRAFPLIGSPKSLVILVNFSDKSFVTPTPLISYSNLLNQENYSTNGGTGSARDFFMASSYGKFSPNFDVVGPYTLTNNMAYYGANDKDGNDVKAEYMIAEACAAADKAGVDFTQYDTDNNGIVDNVFIYYAGFNEAEDGTSTNINANTVWPHRWDLESSGYTGTKVFDGKTVNDYACTSELQGSSGGAMCGIGTFCHEFGHVIGLPDYYHTGGLSTFHACLEEWSIMDGGSYNNAGRTPPCYSAYDRFYLGYLTPQEANSSSNLSLSPIYQGKTAPTNTDNQAFLLSAIKHNLSGSNPSPTEFFLLEYRKKTGWDTYLPGEGMLIWHIDYNSASWNSNGPNNYTGTSQTASSHMGVYLQPLSGSSTSPGDAFTTGSFIPTTWSGTTINRAISTIVKSPANLTFKLTVAVPTIGITGGISPFSTLFGTPAQIQSVTISGTNLTNNVIIGLQDQTNFDIKLSTASTWGKTVEITPSLKSANAIVQVRYSPLAPGTHSNQMSLTSIGAETVSIPLNGTAIDPNAPMLQAGRIDGQLQFPNTTVNTTCAKVLNIKTTDIISDLSISVTGPDASMFTVSASSLTKSIVNGITGINITSEYKPSAEGSHTAILTISGGGLNPAKVINLSGVGVAKAIKQ